MILKCLKRNFNFCLIWYAKRHNFINSKTGAFKNFVAGWRVERLLRWIHQICTA